MWSGPTCQVVLGVGQIPITVTPTAVREFRQLCGCVDVQLQLYRLPTLTLHSLYMYCHVTVHNCSTMHITVFLSVFQISDLALTYLQYQ